MSSTDDNGPHRRKGRLIFRAWKRDAQGNIVRASDYGLKAWPIWIDG